MKLTSGIRGIFLFLVVISLAVTGSAVFADASKSVHPGSLPPALNPELLLTDHMQSSGPLPQLNLYATTTGESISNQNILGVVGVRNFSSTRTYIPAKSLSGVEGIPNQLFSTLLKSFQEHPPGQFYFDSSPISCFY
jgi:hypothetical protein